MSMTLCHTELPLSKLSLDQCRVKKLTLDLNTHSIQYATKIIINTSRRLKNIKKRTYGSFKTLPTPTDDLVPSLMVEVCVVLAPDVNFFLNSRNQGLPCWRSLSFFYLLNLFYNNYHKNNFKIPFRSWRACIVFNPEILSAIGH